MHILVRETFSFTLHIPSQMKFNKRLGIFLQFSTAYLHTLVLRDASSEMKNTRKIVQGLASTETTI